MWQIVTVVVVLTLIMWGIRAGRTTAGDERWPVVTKPLLSVRETELFNRLETSFPTYRVFVQVALSQLVEVRHDTPNRQSIQNKFFRLVADFVLCRRDLSVLAVIELDDTSHTAAKRQDADRRKEMVLESAGIRLVRIPAGSIPSVEELQRLITVGGTTPKAGVTAPAMSAETHTLVKPIFNLAALVVILIGGCLVYAHFRNIGLPTMLPPPIVPAPTIASVKPAAVVVPTVPFVSAPPMPSAAQQAEQKRIVLERNVVAQQAANALAQRKVAAWSEFYQAPASCEHPASWEAQVECGNQYIRAKKAFEMQWEAQLRAEQPARDSKVAEAGGG